MASIIVAIIGALGGMKLFPWVSMSLGIMGAVFKFHVPISSLPTPKRNTVVRVQVGLDNNVLPDHPLIGAGGIEPRIVAFDEDRKMVGMSNIRGQGHINSGGYIDIEVHHRKDREFTQAPLLQVLARYDRICIAWIMSTWTDGTNRAWVGNQGPACAYEWGYSNYILADGKGHDFKPYCTWIEASRKVPKEIYASALQINLESFKVNDDHNSTDNSDNEDFKSFCNAPKMLFLDVHDYDLDKDFKFNRYPKLNPVPEVRGELGIPRVYEHQKIPYNPPPELATLTEKPLSTATYAAGLVGRHLATDVPASSPSSAASAAQKRALAKRNEALTMHTSHYFITVEDPQHSAELACTKHGYLGPDVFSLHEKLFCDVQTKTLWKQCESDDANADEEGCFHKEALSLVHAGNKYKRDYTRNELWRLNGDIEVDGRVINKV